MSRGLHRHVPRCGGGLAYVDHTVFAIAVAVADGRPSGWFRRASRR